MSRAARSSRKGGPASSSCERWFAASVGDPDSLDLAGATISITTGAFAGDGDMLAANTSGTSVTASYNSTTETLTLSGSDTLAHYQSVLDTVSAPLDEPQPDRLRLGNMLHQQVTLSNT